MEITKLEKIWFIRVYSVQRKLVPLTDIFKIKGFVYLFIIGRILFIADKHWYLKIIKI